MQHAQLPNTPRGDEDASEVGRLRAVLAAEFYTFGHGEIEEIETGMVLLLKKN